MEAHDEHISSTCRNPAAIGNRADREVLERSRFRKEVVSDPKGMLEKHLGRKLPEQVKIFIHEEDANTLHMSIPPVPANVSELSDEDLEKVAGGTDVFIVTALGMTVGIVGAGLVKAGVEGGW